MCHVGEESEIKTREEPEMKHGIEVEDTIVHYCIIGLISPVDKAGKSVKQYYLHSIHSFTFYFILLFTFR